VKVAFDIQPLLTDTKTGVSNCAAGFVRSLIAAHPQTKFALDFFSFPEPETRREKAKRYLKDNVELNDCSFFSGKVYRFLSALLPLPYCFFFRSNADLTHFFNFVIPPFVKGKKIVTIHDMVFRRFPETMNARTKFMLKLTMHKTFRRADRIITVSEFSKQEILHYYRYPADKIKVIYNGVDLQTFRTGIDRDKIGSVCGAYRITGEYILYIGMIEPRKNIERLIEAYAVAKKGVRDFPKLVIAGAKGWLFGSIFQKVAVLGLEADIVFTGYISDEDKPALLSGAKFFCFPSLYEGFGIPPLEAMACGCPVLVSRAASLPEVCGDAAFYVDPFAVQSIADAMVRLNEDASLRAALREKGIEQVKKFNWARLGEQLYDVYREAAGE
jgi:glycosyltransferase involved in cell wall biosynthesis